MLLVKNVVKVSESVKSARQIFRCPRVTPARKDEATLEPLEVAEFGNFH